jgi:nucleoside-diphosphate-sugar epimerase
MVFGSSDFYVGSGVQKSVYDVVNEMGKETTWDTSVRPEEPDRKWQADITKTKNELGWGPNNSLGEGLRKIRSGWKEMLNFMW